MESVIRQFRERGAHVAMAWLETGMAHLSRTLITGDNMNQRVEALWQRYLRLSLKDTSEKILPSNALHAHKITIKPCILEVIAVDDIGYAHPRLLDALAGPILPGGVQQAVTSNDNEDEEEDEEDTEEAERAVTNASTNTNTNEQTRRLPRGTLKLTLTDGYELLFGLEKTHVAALDLRMPPGSKIWISEMEIRRGVIYLKPESIRVLRCGRNVAQLADMNNMTLDPTERELLSMEEIELRLQRELDRIGSSNRT